MGALASLTFIPLACADYAPMQDLAAHVESSCQLLNVWQGDARFTSILDVQRQPWANSLPTVVLAALLAISPSYAMAKLLVFLCAFAWPLSLAFCFRAFGRSPWLAVIALPTIYDLSWSYGFLQFIAAKPLLPLVLVLALRAANIKRGIALAALLVVVFVTHSLVFLLSMAGAALVIAICNTSWRDRALRMWPLVVAGSSTLPFFLATRGERGQTRFHDPITAIKDGWQNLGDLHPGFGDTIVWIVALVCVVVTIGVHERETRSREWVALAAVGAVALAGYLVGPTVLPQVSVVSPRLAGVAVALLIGILPAPRGSLIVPVMTVAFLWHIVDVTRSYREFSRAEMGEFSAMLEKVPDGARMATHYTSTSSKFARHNALWHWGKLHCLSGDGFTDDLFAYRTTAYVYVKDKRFMTMPHRMNANALSRFDALLVRGNARPPPDFGLTEKAGVWQLYLRRRGASPRPTRGQARPRPTRPTRERRGSCSLRPRG